jgi:phage tail-like protein
MASRTDPYGKYNYIVDVSRGGRDRNEPLGGFSDVSYRDGDDPGPHIVKIPSSHKIGDVTLKRGVVNSGELQAWITEATTNGHLVQHNVTITLRDEASNPVLSWKLRNVVPVRFTGPALSAKGGGDVAIEELVLSPENIEISSAS